MKTALLCVVTIASMAAAAPTLSQGTHIPHHAVIPHNYIRHKRSSYGGYGAPCGASLPAPVPYQLSLGPAIHPSIAQHAAYAPAPHHGYGGGYGLPQYRDVGEEQDMMSFSDMEPFMSEHMPMSRYAYAPAPVSHYGSPVGLGLGGHIAPAASSAGSVIGVFPNSNVGGCSVPLLLSCSPNVSQGKIIKQQQPHYAAAAPAIAIAPEAYRGVAEQAHSQIHEPEQHQTHEMHGVEENHAQEQAIHQ